MKETTLYIIFLLMTVSEKIFITVTSFVFRCWVGYYSFGLFKPKNPRDEINDFFLSYTRKYGIQRRVFDEKIRRSENQ